MNPPKVDELDYIQFLVAAQKVFSAMEASKVHPDESAAVAHDAYTRLLQRVPPDSAALWTEVEPLVKREAGVLVLDDSTLDKPYARQMGLVSSHWSGKHGRVVEGINLISLVWTDGEATLPCDFRLYDKAQDGLSKNEHVRAMIRTAKARGFAPRLVGFDSWYSGLDNLKLLRDCHWAWLTQLKSNRLVNADGSGNRPISDSLIPPHGAVVHLKGYGWIKVFKTVDPHGNVEDWATSDLSMTIEQCAWLALDVWQVEVYHRGLKQFTGIERAQFRLALAQRNHIGLALRAFVRLEAHRIRTNLSWCEAKASIIRSAIRAYLTCPTITLNPTA